MEENNNVKKIKKIEVKKLFGFFDYCVDDSQSLSTDRELLVIYGDNGSGKTTLLKMMFYLLSPISKSGYKTKLNHIKFQYFGITFSDETLVSVERNGDNITGGFTLEIIKDGLSTSVYLKPDEEGSIVTSNLVEIETKYVLFLKRLRDLNIEINFLSEDRKLLSFSDSGEKKALIRRKSISQILANSGKLGAEYNEDITSEDNVSLSIKNLEQWLKSNTLKGAKAGEENANTIYSKLLTQVSKPRIKDVSKAQINALLNKIKKVGQESASFNESGLVSQIEIDNFEVALRESNDSNKSLIYNILEPYIEGVQGRLNSLRNVQNILSRFLVSVNDYFSNKSISYNLETGFKMMHVGLGEPVDFTMLSSGEKQLLLLFCNVITSSEKSTIFVIDEPEISLNVKWQRKLISTLLNFSINKNIQFIFASHSIELLSGHRHSVHKLNNTNV